MRSGLFALLVIQATLLHARVTDPFAFFEPAVSLTAEERKRLDSGGNIARVVPAQEHDVAVFAAVPVNVGGDRLVAWIRRIEALKKTSYVLAIRRVSAPVRLEDFDSLTVESGDLDDIRNCRPGKCALKLTAVEIESLQAVIQQHGTAWKPAVERAFRQIVFERIKTYGEKGHEGFADVRDVSAAHSPAHAFAGILQRSDFLTRQLPQLAEHLRRPPSQSPAIESFIYWSKELFSRKTVISATQVSIVRPDREGLPEVVIASKQIFATHYMDASLGITAIVRDGPSKRYLTYLNRSDVDVVGGFFGGLVRSILQRRLRNEAPGILIGLRERLESGEPPPAALPQRSRENNKLDAEALRSTRLGPCAALIGRRRAQE
jgi:hypothetical protein